MKKLLAVAILSLVALSLSGCGCSRTFSSWFNRGSSCAPADPCAVAPRATMFGGGQVPPGAEIVTPYPTN